MSKQNQSHDGINGEERKKEFATPQGSHKEKALENLEDPDPEKQGHLQGSKSNLAQSSKHQESKKRSPQSFDRNEGQGKGQKS